ncbi:MAG: hypothetical protein L0H84_18250 [Pseudonocardia sp.]|nr:hypothetical protein [Pseudonocardia sp.]
MIGDYLLPLMGLVGGSVLLTVLVAALLLPPLRRLGRARAVLASGLAAQTAALRALRAERPSSRAGAPAGAATSRLAPVDSVEGSVT